MSELASANQKLRREIAERQRAETELRRAFALLDQHVNNTPLGMTEWEQDHTAREPPRVCRWSGQAQRIFGWRESEILGLSGLCCMTPCLPLFNGWARLKAIG